MEIVVAILLSIGICALFSVGPRDDAQENTSPDTNQENSEKN